MAWISRLAHRLLTRKQDYARAFSGPGGARVLDDLMRACGTGQNPAVPGDAITTGINIGRQLIGQHILNNLHMPDGEIVARANRLDPEGGPDGIQSENGETL